MSESIGDRMKRYEKVYQYSLTPRSCLFVRVDGKAFHSFTRGLERPFSQVLMDCMVNSAIETAKEMQGFKLAYIQSDECTFMLTDFYTLQTQGWFGYELSKIISISASLFTANFNRFMRAEQLAFFDSRAFIVPTEEAPNVFIWRQRDWERNSIQMLAQAHYSSKQLHGKGSSAMHEMLYQKGVNWAELPDQWKNGTFINRRMEKLFIRFDYESLQKETQI